MILKPGNEPAGKALETGRIIVLLFTDLHEEDNVIIKPQYILQRKN